MERPRVELEAGRRAGSWTIAVAISRFVTASVKPAARPARGAASIVRCDRGLQRFVAAWPRRSKHLMSVWRHATCADRDVHSSDERMRRESARYYSHDIFA